MSKQGRTFVLVKPDGVRRGLMGEIVSRFEKKGFTISRCELVTPTKALAADHYIEHKGKSFYDRVVEYLSSGPVLAMVLEGHENCYQTVRKMIGATFPENADPGTIRGDLSLCRPENVVHGSDSNESAEREIALWFPNK